MLSDRLRQVTLDCPVCKGQGPEDCSECHGAGQTLVVQGNLILSYLAGAQDLRQLLVRGLAQARDLEKQEQQRQRLGDRAGASRLAHVRVGLVLMAQAVETILERASWQGPREVLARPLRRKG